LHLLKKCIAAVAEVEISVVSEKLQWFHPGAFLADCPAVNLSTSSQNYVNVLNLTVNAQTNLLDK